MPLNKIYFLVLCLLATIKIIKRVSELGVFCSLSNLRGLISKVFNRIKQVLDQTVYEEWSQNVVNLFHFQITNVDCYGNNAT